MRIQKEEIVAYLNVLLQHLLAKTKDNNLTSIMTNGNQNEIQVECILNTSLGFCANIVDLYRVRNHILHPYRTYGKINPCYGNLIWDFHPSHLLSCIKLLLCNLAQAVMLVTYIQGMIGFNLSQNYPELSFQWFSSVSPDKCWDSVLKQTAATSFHVLPNLSFINHLTLQCYIVWDTKSGIKSKMKIKLL